jgi:hypothetical protein
MLVLLMRGVWFLLVGNVDEQPEKIKLNNITKKI